MGAFDIVVIANVQIIRMAAFLKKLRDMAGVIRVIAMLELNDPNASWAN